MCGDKPKKWSNWLLLAEYWYNTYYHTTIKTTPYQVVYGQPPPVHIVYAKGDSRVDMVDRTLETREEGVKLLKFHFKRTQERMKEIADKHITEREFEVNDWVYLKLQPYRQSTIRQSKNRKLSAKYYGPFQVIQKVGKVAYKLQLPATAQIHSVFHVSQLRRYKGETPKEPGKLPLLNGNGLVAVEPFAILDRKLAKKGNAPVVYVLVHWTNGPVADATWESYDDIAPRFPQFDINA